MKSVKESEEIGCIHCIVTYFEELLSQTTDFPICIFCTSAVLFLVLVIARRNLTVVILDI